MTSQPNSRTSTHMGFSHALCRFKTKSLPKCCVGGAHAASFCSSLFLLLYILYCALIYLNLLQVDQGHPIYYAITSGKSRLRTAAGVPDRQPGSLDLNLAMCLSATPSKAPQAYRGSVRFCEASHSSRCLRGASILVFSSSSFFPLCTVGVSVFH